MKIQLLFLLLSISIALHAQDGERKIITLSPEHFSDQRSVVYDKDGAIYEQIGFAGKQTEWIEVPIDANPFLAFSVAWKYSGAIYYQFEDEEDEQQWLPLKPDTHFHSDNGRQVSSLIFEKKEKKRLKLLIDETMSENADLDYIELHFYSPGISEKKAIPKQVFQENNSCPCPQPEYLDRQGWCPNNDCDEHPNPQQTNVTHLIVHHAAGTNASSNWSGVVRSIWDYHVNTNGWDDIGYNWLIDPNGVVYEGRGDNIQGAHFCGNNGGTAGICMLGNFTTVTPSNAALEKLTEFLSWKACDIDVDPEASAFHASSNKTLPRISGHRDGCSTACPGDLFYPLFPTLRNDVKNYQDAECTEFLAPSNLNAWATSESSIQMQWKDNSQTETAFLLERSKNNNTNYTEIAQIPANTNFYTDTNLKSFSSYFYRVRAANGSNTTDYSNEYGVATILTNNQTVELENTEIKIHPNPGSGPLQFSLAGTYLGKVKLTLIDLQGRRLQEWDLNKATFGLQEVLDLEKMEAGIFILKVNMENEAAYVKVLLTD